MRDLSGSLPTVCSARMSRIGRQARCRAGFRSQANHAVLGDSRHVSWRLTVAEPIDEARVLSDVLASLRPLDAEARRKILHTAATFYGLSSSIADQSNSAVPPVERHRIEGFSADRTASPKQFIHEKDPVSETERIVCLAYYLTHYRGISHFKTLDLTQLNTEAAQVKFSNASATVHSASEFGLLAPAPNGNKQISARGERFVSVLPDREAARAVMTERRGASRRAKRKRPVSTPPREG
jgi:hypothetical protein